MLFEPAGGVITWMNTDLSAYRIFFPYAVGMDRYRALKGADAPSPEALRAFMHEYRMRFMLGALTRLGKSAPPGWVDDRRIVITRIPSGSPKHQEMLEDRWELERPRTAAEMEEIWGFKPSDC